MWWVTGARSGGRPGRAGNAGAGGWPGRRAGPARAATSTAAYQSGASVQRGGGRPESGSCRAAARWMARCGRRGRRIALGLTAQVSDPGRGQFVADRGVHRAPRAKLGYIPRVRLRHGDADRAIAWYPGRRVPRFPPKRPEEPARRKAGPYPVRRRICRDDFGACKAQIGASARTDRPRDSNRNPPAVTIEFVRMSRRT